MEPSCVGTGSPTANRRTSHAEHRPFRDPYQGARAPKVHLRHLHATLRGFGVCVLSSGTRRPFIHIQYRGKRIWKVVGDANAMTLNEVRTGTTSILDAIRCQTENTRFEAVVEAVFRRHARVWKAGTLGVNRCYLRCQILPAFAGRVAVVGRGRAPPAPDGMLERRDLGPALVRLP